MNKFFLLGMMGAGKSSTGIVLAGKLTLPFFDLDREIETKEKKSIVELFNEGESSFRYRERAALQQIIRDNNEFVLATGGGTPAWFDNLNLMNKTGTTIFLNAEVEVLMKRIKQQNQQRPLLSEDNLKNTLLLHKLLIKRSVYYINSTITVNANKAINEIADEIYTSLNEKKLLTP